MCVKVFRRFARPQSSIYIELDAAKVRPEVDEDRQEANANLHRRKFVLSSAGSCPWRLRSTCAVQRAHVQVTVPESTACAIHPDGNELRNWCLTLLAA